MLGFDDIKKKPDSTELSRDFQSQRMKILKAGQPDVFQLVSLSQDTFEKLIHDDFSFTYYGNIPASMA